MAEERQTGRAGVGCAAGLVTLLAGVAVGGWLTLSILGLGFDALLRGAAGESATPVVGLAATEAPPLVPIQGQAAPGRRLVWDAPIPLDTDTQEPDLLVISRNYDLEPSSDSIVYFSPDMHAVRWESQPLGDNGSSWVVAYGDEVVLVADGERLVALSRDTGGPAWEAPLTDSIADSICEDCLQVFGDVVVALPQDGRLQAINAATGAPLWTVRLREATRQIVAVGGKVGVPDSESAESNNGALFLFNPQDGSPAGVIKPACKDTDDPYESSISYYGRTGHDPAGRTLVWLVSSSPVCLVAYDVRSGAISRTMLEDFGSSDLSPMHSLWAGDTLYLSDDEQIIAVGPQESRRVLVSEDYDLRPLAASEGVLLVQAERTRGSSRLELWVVDPRTGEHRWERVLEADDPLDYRGDTGDFTAMLTGDTLTLVEKHDDPEEVVYEQIALADGSSRVRAVVQVDDAGDYIRGALWGRGHVFLPIDELYAVELTSGQTAYRWP
ncbi:MAG: PQQ-binding-like beta-propeller repeat protein [Chloroflexales bacterium]|nr:PQQ-binding-like beta-propeller repeat protein [Chloroflexales bacterium]